MNLERTIVLFSRDWVHSGRWGEGIGTKAKVVDKAEGGMLR